MVARGPSPHKPEPQRSSLVSPDEPTTTVDRVGREGGDTHRHDRPFRGGQWPDRAQELLRPSPVDHPQDGVAARGEPQRALPPILGLLVAFDEPPPDEPVDEPTRGRRRPTDRLGQLADREGAAVGQHVQRGQLGEPEAQLAELAGKADDELPPERPAHRHALADLADVREPVAGRQDRRREVCLVQPGDRPGRRRSGRRAMSGAFVGHRAERTVTRRVRATVHATRACARSRRLGCA